MPEHTVAEAKRIAHPLERAWALLRVARSTSSEVEFIDALNGALEGADWCFKSEAALIRTQIADLQRERGPLLVPAQLGGAPARPPESPNNPAAGSGEER